MEAKTERDECNHLADSHSWKAGLRRHVDRMAATVGMVGVLVLLCVFAVPAVADQDSQSPSGPDLAAGAEEAAEPRSLVDTEAAEEMQLRNLDREGASELVESVFGPVLESAVGHFDDLQVDHFLADNVAVLTPNQPEATSSNESEDDASEGASPILVDSTLPLRTENASGQVQPVDLGLEHHQGELQAANPLVDVAIPNELGEEIELPELGISIGVDGAPEEVSPSIVGESIALYPNVFEDTDFAVTPTPTGVEMLTHLRSASSDNADLYAQLAPRSRTSPA